MNYIIAVDQSTSATKAVLYDTAGRQVDAEAVEHPQIYPRPGWVEHDAEVIWRNALTVVARLAGRNASAAGGAIALAVTNQRETFVVFDRATGMPLGNAIVWQCRRADELCRELREAGHDGLVRRKTGLRIDTYFSGPKLAWLMRERPDVRRKLAEGSALVGTIDTYLIYRLTGGRIFATDATNASRTLLFDISRLRWDEELCSLFDVPARAMPEVRESTGGYGETDLAGTLGRRIPIWGVMGDSQAALLGHGCIRAGMAKVTLGTGSSVLLNTGATLPRTDDEGSVATIAWTHRSTATYCREGIINYCAATIAWLKDQLGLIRSPDECASAATAVEDNGGVYLVPAFAGLSAPYWAPGARAAIVGISSHSNRNHVIRAALESIAYQLRDVLEMMGSDQGVPLSHVHADGGATRNRFLMQFVADVVGRRLLVSNTPGCSSLGVALAGAIGMGVYGSFDEIGGVAREQTAYDRVMDPAAARYLYDGWKRSVRQVLTGADGPVNA